MRKFLEWLKESVILVVCFSLLVGAIALIVSAIEITHPLETKSLKLENGQNIVWLECNYENLEKWLATHKDINIVSISSDHLWGYVIVYTQKVEKPQ